MAINYYIIAASASLLLLGGCGVDDSIERSRELYGLGNVHQAFDILEEAQKLHPEDEAIRKEYEVVRVAHRLRLAQSAIFAGEERKALGFLRLVLAADPGNEVAISWMSKAKRKLAVKASDVGEEAVFAGDYEKALRAYHESLQWEPGFAMAKEGVAKIAEIYNKRRVKARGHYLEGVRVLAEQLFHQTEYHMFNAVDKDPDLERARLRHELARRRIAEQQLEYAAKMSAVGFHAAALKEYRDTREVLGERADIDELIEDVKREVRAQDLTQQAESHLFRGEYEESASAFEEAYDLSEMQRPYINQMLVLVKERDMGERYRLAKDHELERHFEQAAAAFSEIDAIWPGFKDVKARISDLESAIEVASTAFATGQAAEKKGELKAAIEAYGEAVLVYPGYKGLDQRIEQLKAKL